MRTPPTLHTVEEGSRRRAELLRSTLPVRRVGFLVGVNVALPLVELDATGRPELLDLGRVHRSEGEGDMYATWDVICSPVDGVTAILQLELKRPVRCTFSLAFDVGPYRDWLAPVAESGVLATVFVANGAPPREEECVAWQIHAPGLADALFLESLTRKARPRSASGVAS